MMRFGQQVPGAALVQLPGEPEPLPAGWLLARLIACELDGPNSPTCRGQSNNDARERRIALAVASIVKDVIPACPSGPVVPLVVDVAQSAGLVIYWSEVQRDRELPPYHPSDPFYSLPPLDVRRFAEYRARVANRNYADGCAPDPETPGPPPGGYPPVPGIPDGPDPPTAPTTPTIEEASANAIGVLFLLGGAALVVAGRRR